MPGWNDATSPPLSSEDEQSYHEVYIPSPSSPLEEYKDAKSEVSIETFADLYNCMRDALLGEVGPRSKTQK
jgi:hypothetical protein